MAGNPTIRPQWVKP